MCSRPDDPHAGDQRQQRQQDEQRQRLQPRRPPARAAVVALEQLGGLEMRRQRALRGRAGHRRAGYAGGTCPNGVASPCLPIATRIGAMAPSTRYAGTSPSPPDRRASMGGCPPAAAGRGSTPSASGAGSPTGRLQRVHHGVYAVGHLAPSMLGDYLRGGAGRRRAARSSSQRARGARVQAHARQATAGARDHRPDAAPPPPPGHRDPPRRGAASATTSPSTKGSRSRPCRGSCSTSRRACRRPSSPAPATRRGSTTARRRSTSRPCIARNPRKPGIAKLRRALGSDVTLSDLEDAFLILLRQHGLPLPRTNIDRHGDKVDCHWPQHGLTVELLSYRFHATRDGFEKDVARRRRSQHVAFTWGDVVERPAATAAELRQLLSRARSSPTRLEPRAYST